MIMFKILLTLATGIVVGVIAYRVIKDDEKNWTPFTETPTEPNI